ncbi:MAG: 16S rRNA (adenine(1518)-N(6)/adenine(1519)-N(6))-dimethyltransferase RsmA [Candidatus Sericytochromatia bacterium]|nr:16S rRNA (adenine(1518)-N(6)/adenine(1519)-N(6))-dimethyltransferase RsmA [Candidatus Sericytochromatia bacterium]
MSLVRGAHRPKRRLGQNFLQDETVRASIVEAAEIQSTDQVLEIGPGRGFLTDALLAAQPKRIVAVELDRFLGPYLEPIQIVHSNFEVVWGDFLKTPWAAYSFSSEAPVKVVANIPYYITTPILLQLLQAERLAREPLETVLPLAERIILMVQWEVAQRLLAQPGGKDYGSLSLIAQYAAEVSLITRVPAGAFRPKPAVDSAVVMLKPRHHSHVQVSDPYILSRVIRSAFQQRRKTLRNGLLAGGFLRDDLERSSCETGISLSRRAETLSLQEFVGLANALATGA